MNVLICDDEKRQVQQCASAVRSIMQFHGMGGEIFESERCDGSDFKQKVQNSQLIIFDIELNGADGMQAADKLRAEGYDGQIVFFSKHAERMQEAFDVSALNFLVKGKDSVAELERVLLRAYRILTQDDQAVLIFHNAKETRRIPVSEITYFAVDKRIITVKYGKNSFDFYAQLGHLEQTLGAKGFFRCHRGYLIALTAVSRLCKLKDKRVELVMTNGDKIPVGRGYLDPLRERMHSEGSVVQREAVSR